MPKKPSIPVIAETTTHKPIVHQSNKQATEFKIDGQNFKFDTTGFTPIITTTPAYNNLFRGQDRGVHVHNNPLYGSNGRFFF